MCRRRSRRSAFPKDDHAGPSGPEPPPTGPTIGRQATTSRWRDVRIKVHPSLCVGNGACRQFASSVYHLDDEGYLDLHLLQVPPELERDAEVGASACPARAISVLADAPAPDRRAGALP